MAVTINGTTGITTPDITSDSATVDTTTLVVDDTNNRVGIGTTSPQQKTHIADGGLQITGAITAPASGQTGALIDYASDGARFWSRGTSTVRGTYSFIQLENDGGNQQTAMSIDSSGNLGFNSGYGSAVTAYGCRAWVRFDGSGTVAINGSGNVSSITDNGLADYTVNLTTAMPDVNFAVTACSRNNNSVGVVFQNTASIRVTAYQITGSTLQDSIYVGIAVFR